MQNMSIINNTESIIEMQICCLIFIIILSADWEKSMQYGVGMREQSKEAIMNFGMSYYDLSFMITYLMLAEHSLSYLFSYVKMYDIKKRGVIAENGVESTGLCTVLNSISYFLEVVIALICIIHIV